MRPIPGIRGTAAGLMRERDFRLIWTVGILAEFGRRNELLVWSLLLFKVVEAPASYLMLLWVFNNLPRPFVSPIAGYIADRFSRQRVMLLTQAVNLVSAGGVLALMLNGLDSLQSWHIFLVAFIQGTTKAIEDPSRRTGIFDIVGRERLVNAMSLDVIAQNVGKMIGPVVGGLLIRVFRLSGGLHFPDCSCTSLTCGSFRGCIIPEAGPTRHAMPPMWSRDLGNAFGCRLEVRESLVGMLSITLVDERLGLPSCNSSYPPWVRNCWPSAKPLSASWWPPTASGTSRGRQ